jgi:hypothetical protein
VDGAEVRVADPMKNWLVDLLDRAYDRKSWHSPNLKGAIRGLEVEQAVWRPAPDRRSIAEQVLHAAYWKYVTRRKLRGDKRGSFPLKGSNWFAVEDSLTEDEWREHVRLLQGQHEALREAVVEIASERLHAVPEGEKWSDLNMIQGVAFHDIYHAGQIQLLKRLQAG